MGGTCNLPLTSEVCPASEVFLNLKIATKYARCKVIVVMPLYVVGYVDGVLTERLEYINNEYEL